jgi:hypothetical protein
MKPNLPTLTVDDRLRKLMVFESVLDAVGETTTPRIEIVRLQTEFAAINPQTDPVSDFHFADERPPK